MDNIQKIILLLMLLLVTKAHSQDLTTESLSKAIIQYAENDTVPRTVFPAAGKLTKPAILLNDKYVSVETFKTLSHNIIESVTIDPSKITLGEEDFIGTILVKTKPNTSLNLISLDSLVKKYAGLHDERCVFSIDGEIVNADQKLTLVDENNIMQIKPVKLDKYSDSSTIYFIKILTRTEKNLKEANTVYIKGNDLGLNL